MAGSIHTLSKNFLFKNLLVPAAVTATANSGSVDCRGWDRALIIFTVGVVSGTSPTMDVKLQDSADNSTFADVTSGTFTQVTATATTPALMDIDLTKRNRYIRTVDTIGGSSTPTINMGLVVMLGRGRRFAPTQDQNAKSV